MKLIAPPPLDKRALGKAVGDELLKRHGKQRHYSFQRIADVVDLLGFGADALSWALALFASPEDFEAYHATIGQPRDYGSMKSEIFDAMTEGASLDWFDIDMSWLEWPDFDFGSLFDFFDIG
ncbi:MAG: hypothetical protein V4773_26920 [Verrucomicrobiota bacterium]